MFSSFSLNWEPNLPSSRFCRNSLKLNEACKAFDEVEKICSETLIEEYLLNRYRVVDVVLASGIFFVSDARLCERQMEIPHIS